MSRSAEDRAFRRLKRIEWRLAYIEREKRHLEKSIRRTADPRRYIFRSLMVLAAFVIIMSAFLVVISGVPAPDENGMPNLAAFCMTGLLGFVIFMLVFSWAVRKETLEKLLRLKTGMENLTRRLERRREEIYQKYPDLREREIKVRFPYDIFRVGEAIVFLIFAIEYYLLLKSPGSPYSIIAQTPIFVYFFLEYLRERQYLSEPVFRGSETEPVDPLVQPQREERFDIPEYKRF